MSWKNNVMVKVITIGILTIALLIPLGMFLGLTYEREATYEEAVQEVSSKWGMEQKLIGPVLTIPYRQMEQNDKGWYETIKMAQFLPDSLSVDGEIIPQVRSRGIYEVVLYQLQNDISAEFSFPDWSAISIDEGNVLWDQAMVSMGITDLRGIQNNISFTWNEQEHQFLPGVYGIGLYSSGIHANLDSLNETRREKYQMKFSLDLQGSQQVSIAPVAKNNSVSLKSDWPSPSFNGYYLPSEREVTEEGFSSSWQISYFSRSYPQQWSDEQLKYNDIEGKVQDSLFGVNLIMPVDYYQQNTRSMKYGILFILLTFAAFFLFEVLNRLRIHPFQYLLVGTSMVLFYLLLLSLSEHLGFTTAYLLSSMATITLVSAYCFKILSKKSRGIIMLLLMTFIYGYLYILLQMEDYSLLIGSLSLFGFMAIIMYLTRNIDWYSLKMNRENSNNQHSE